MFLASTSYSTPESVTPGSGRGEVIGGGGAPLRYEFTARALHAFSSWNSSTYTYSILQLYKGYNPLSKIEVVSSLNLFNQGRGMYYYTLSNCTERYYPKVYIGTSQTIAYAWNYDRQNGQNLVISNWPQSYQQGSQKGEANI